MYFGTKNIGKTKYKIMSTYQYTRIFQISFNQGGRKKKTMNGILKTMEKTWETTIQCLIIKAIAPQKLESQLQHLEFVLNQFQHAFHETHTQQSLLETIN